MDIPAIPSKINNYNVYNVAERLIGVGDEVPLPDFEALADTISGAGILGELDDPTVGHFSNMEMEIPFRVIDQEAADMMDMTKAVQLTLRAAQQTLTVEGPDLLRGHHLIGFLGADLMIRRLAGSVLLCRHRLVLGSPAAHQKQCKHGGKCREKQYLTHNQPPMQLCFLLIQFILKYNRYG